MVKKIIPYIAIIAVCLAMGFGIAKCSDSGIQADLNKRANAIALDLSKSQVTIGNLQGQLTGLQADNKRLEQSIGILKQSSGRAVATGGRLADQIDTSITNVNAIADGLDGLDQIIRVVQTRSSIKD